MYKYVLTSHINDISAFFSVYFPRLISKKQRVLSRWIYRLIVGLTAAVLTIPSSVVAIDVDYLPSLITWDADAYPNQEYYDEQVRLIELGHPIIPTIYVGAPGTEITNANAAHYRKILSLASELDLPISIRFPDWKYWLTLNPYFILPPADNPNFLDLAGQIHPKVSPLGNEEAWAALGSEWGTSPIFRVFQQWYPDPPFILFLSQDREAEITTDEMQNSHRFTQLYGTNRSSQFIQNVIEEGYQTRYDALIRAFDETLTSWDDRTIFYYERDGESAENITRILHSDLGGSGEPVTQKITSEIRGNAFLSSVLASSFIPASTIEGNIEQSTSAMVQLWTKKPRVLLLPETGITESADALTERILNALDEIRIHPALRQFWFTGESVPDDQIQDSDEALILQINRSDHTGSKLLIALSKTGENAVIETALEGGSTVTVEATIHGNYYMLDESGYVEPVAPYDGNSDSIPDRDQPSVASLPTPTGVGTLTLESMAGGEFINTQFIATDASLRKQNLESTARDIVNSQGLEDANFLVTTLRNSQVRDSRVNIFVPEQYREMTFYLGFGQNGFAEYALQKSDDARGQISITVRDGGSGDADGTQNGEIVLLGIFAPSPGTPDVEMPQDDPLVCFPNPFNPSRAANIRIRFEDTGSEATIRIYDLGGRLVKTLHSSSVSTEVLWDGMNGAGRQVASGTYFVVVENSDRQRMVEKISLIR